jgi:hypothetical protein
MHGETMYLNKDHMQPVDEIIEEEKRKGLESGVSPEYIDVYVIGALQFIIKDFQKFVTDLQEQVKPQ